MKPFLPTLSLAAALALGAGLAHAQLKPPKGDGTAPAPAATPAAPAAAAGPSHPEEQAAARLAAAGWLTLLDRRDWGRAWESSARMFRDTVPLDAWMESIPKVRGPMGTLVQRDPVESNFRTSLPGRPEGEYVSVIFRSHFSDRDVAEVVTTVHEPDGKWRVTGYSPR
ncbi:MULTISPECIES: DUF4019 domain-containing protein [Ramlibacter]|uniref:DUF4019 domain-containing protein n=1 Tax=Ramlibacter aquaticus TaxID=2780094 RepID=A0ABR9SJW2_9BURK|nr:MULTISPECIES: DUF4019 domain-containing protein [Ramlibacter]MBE7942654.1 DUF4019 domain-containing protein [Ramlibacter aquaticus]